MFARQHQLDADEFDEGAFGLRRFDREAAIEIGDEVLFKVAVGSLGVMPRCLSSCGSRP